MSKSKRNQRLHARPLLPSILSPFFWDYNFSCLTWTADRDLIIGRILAVGNSDSIRWLCRRVSDAELREWLMLRRGGPLGKKSLRYWELILSIPKKQVDAWIADPEREQWNREYDEFARQFDFWSNR